MLWLWRGSPNPFTEEDVERLASFSRSRCDDGRPYVLAMYHYGDYHHLLYLAKLVGRKILIVSKMDAIRVMRLLRLESDEYRFVVRPTVEDLKDVAEGRVLLAMVADVALPGERRAYLPMFGRYHLFTLGWAELAARIGADVICAVHGTEQGGRQLHLEVIGHDPDPFELAYRTCRAFMRTSPRLDQWDARRHHGAFPRIDPARLAWDGFEAVACTDSRLLSLVRQARGTGRPMPSRAHACPEPTGSDR